MDVFGKLNDFLNHEDESFKYDSVGNIDDSMNTKESVDSPQSENQSTESEKQSPQNENEVENLSQNKAKASKQKGTQEKLRRSKRGRATTSQNSSNEDILDLTNEFSFPTHGGKRNRRKLADDIPAVVIEDQIDLSDIASPETSLNISNASSGRGRKGKKPKAPRKVSYKKALEILNAPIPDISVIAPQVSAEFIPQATSTQRSRSNEFAVDLTGDVIMGDIHNKNPLFQKVQQKPKEKKELQEERFSLGLEDDIDLIYVNVKVKGKIKKYRSKMDQRFYDLFKLIADDQEVPVCNVVLLLGEKRIYPEDTPDSINHRVSFIYNCHFMDASNLQVNKKDKIEIKFQSDKWKKPIALKVSRFEPFLSHIQLLCKEVNFKPEQFSLKFDGDDIDIKKSAIELEFEGGEIIDCRVKT